MLTYFQGHKPLETGEGESRRICGVKDANANCLPDFFLLSFKHLLALQCSNTAQNSPKHATSSKIFFSGERPSPILDTSPVGGLIPSMYGPQSCLLDSSLRPPQLDLRLRSSYPTCDLFFSTKAYNVTAVSKEFQVNWIKWIPFDFRLHHRINPHWRKRRMSVILRWYLPRYGVPAPFSCCRQIL